MKRLAPARMKVASLTLLLLLAATNTALHAQNPRTGAGAHVGLGGIPFPVGQDGCGGGSAAVIAGASATHQMTSAVGLQADVSIIKDLGLSKCAYDVVPLAPGTYTFREYDPGSYDDAIVAPAVRIRFTPPGFSLLHASVGAGTTVHPRTIPFVLLAAGLQRGDEKRFSLTAEYRSFRPHHDFVELTVPQDGGAGSKRTIGSGRRPAGGLMVVAGVDVRVR